LDLGQRHFPSKESIEAEMESFVLAKLPDCLNDFTIFAKQGFIVEQGEMRMDVSLHNKAQFELTFPLAIRKGSSLTELSNFFYTVDVDFNNVYSIINETVEEHQKNPNFVPLGHLSTAARDSNFKFGLDYLDNDVVVYSYIFKEYNIDSEDYVFVFAARYDWSELATGKEPDYEQEIEDQHCFVDDRCIYNLNIYNDPFIFNDYTDLFDVSTEGMIEFIPEQNDVGKHNILVRISDQAGAEKYISFEMEIVALNNPPEIREINEQTAIVGQTYTHQIEAIDSENDDIFFYAETALFEISPDGLIEFIPDEESIGFYIIEITAFDGELEDQVWFHLNIENEE